MPVNPLQSHHTAPDTSRASGGRAFAAFDVPLPHAGAKPPEIVRELLHHIGMTDADIARFSQQNGYDLVDHSVTAMQKYGGFHAASVHVTREHPQGIARLEIPRADYDELRHFVNGSATSAMPDSTARSARTGGEAYAAHRGINTTAQVRARLDAKLPVSKTIAPHVTLSSTANSVAPTKPVAQMTTTEKLQVAVERAAAHLGPEAAEKLRQLVTPQNLAIMAGTTAALIAVQGVPVLDVMVDAGIVGVAVYTLGSEAIGVIKDLAGFASGVVNAKTEADLDVAGQHMARAVSTLGVDAVAAVLLHKAGSAIRENMPPSSAMREMVTPEGVRIRMPVEESSPTTHQMSSANKTGGSGAASGGNNPVTLKSLEHIFRGEVNAKGKATGFHYEGAQMEAPYGTKVIESTRSAPDAHGVYTAKVEVRGVSKQAKSSFFPRHWSKAEVVQSVKEAYANRTFPQPSKPAYFEGTSRSGIVVGGYLNSDGTVATAFPIYGR